MCFVFFCHFALKFDKNRIVLVFFSMFWWISFQRCCRRMNFEISWVWYFIVSEITKYSFRWGFRCVSKITSWRNPKIDIFILLHILHQWRHIFPSFCWTITTNILSSILHNNVQTKLFVDYQRIPKRVQKDHWKHSKTKEMEKKQEQTMKKKQVSWTKHAWLKRTCFVSDQSVIFSAIFSSLFSVFPFFFL